MTATPMIPLGAVKIGKPLSTMTVDERAAFVRKVADMARAGFEAAKARVPAVVTATDLDNMVVAIEVGRLWGQDREIPNTPEHHAAWNELVADIEHIHALGGKVEFDF